MDKQDTLKEELSLKVEISDNETSRMKQNHHYWEMNSDKFSDSNEVSWGDKNMMRLEQNQILEYIQDGMAVLDAGCSNGFSTFRIAGQRDIQVQAFDYSKKAIQTALKEQKSKDPEGKITFSEGNILNLDYAENQFDCAYSIRVVINLPSWETQQQSLLQIHRVLKPGGLYLFSEAFSGSLNKLNALRALADLKPLTVHEFNLYLDEEKLEAFVEPYFEVAAVKKFSSIYYVASRFLRYLTMKSDDKDSFDNEFNNFFTSFNETENSGDFGIQKLYVLRKRAS